MHQDGQTDAELTSVYLHHWVADVDSALGGLHHHTLSADEITDYVMRLGMSQVNFYPDSDRDSDPMDRKTIEQLDELILNVCKRAEKAASFGDLKRQGEELHQRLHKVGAQKEPILVVIGRKRLNLL